MTDLNDNEKAALVEALENGGLFGKCDELTRGLEALGLAETPSFAELESSVILTPAGTLLAQAYKAQEPHWVALDECGELEPGRYFTKDDGNPCEWTGSSWGHPITPPTHVYIDPATVVPKVRQ